MKVLLFAKLAYYNLRRYWRRSLLVGLTILLSAAVLVFNHSLGRGIEDQMIRNLILIQTGHILITPTGRDDQGGETGSRWQPFPEELRQKWSADPRIESVQPRLESAAMLSASQQTITRAFLMGLDPSREGTHLDRVLPVLEGNPFKRLGPAEIMLSREYAERLRIRTGDLLTVTIHNAREGTRMKDFRLSGIFKKANPWQEFFLFVPLPDAQELLGSRDRISAVRLILSDPAELSRVMRDLKGILKENKLSWEVKSYREVAGFSLGIVQANHFSIILMDALLLFATALGVSLLVLLSLNLRLSEYHILTWLGTPGGWLIYTVVLEALLLGSTFGMLGMILGGAASLFLNYRGIPISSVPITYLVGGDLLRPLIHFPGLIRIFFLLMGICFVSALIPMANLLRRSGRFGYKYAG